MKAIEQRLPQDYDKSFIVFRESGQFFPCPWHYHPEYELVLITSSTGRRMVGDHIGYFDKEDLVFMGPGLQHVWLNDETFVKGEAREQADGIVIQFVEKFLGEKFLNIPEMDQLKKMFQLSVHGMVILGRTRERINAIMKNMPEMTGLERLSALFNIFHLMANTREYELLASPGYVQKGSWHGCDRSAKITEYIMRNFDSDISLPEIAARSNMAITTFCNFFKENYRTTFVEYLNTVRVGYACKLIAEKNKNVVEIAYECGFKNLANFNRQFKKIKKMTPTDYRRTVDATA
ncbi:AraC family transcriptional regulator [Niabella aurantiaca]|uniref:AraC family transcriptional regulator n=1 Tax=Niabella aurantiaca TaxID=379900 RepID=UPI0003A760C2|nr:AraC family transcriptional regulator [Niabella aurantiaca]